MPIDRTNYNALVDDDGSNTIGSVWNKLAIKNVLLDPIDVALGSTAVIQTTALTGTQHNFPLVANCRILRCNNTAPLTLTGMSAGYDGQTVTLITSLGTAPVTLAHFTTSNPALYNVVTSGPTTILQGMGSATYVYNAPRGIWELRQHEQGGGIVVPYSAASFSAGGGMSWTVEAGDVITQRYVLTGRVLTVWLALYTTSVGGTLGNTLLYTLPAGYQAAALQTGLFHLSENGVTTYGQANTAANSPTVSLLKSTSANFAASTNALYILGQFAFEVI